MKKVLFLVTQSEMGGAQRYIYEVIRGLNPKNNKFLVAAGEGDEELFEKIKNLKLKIKNLRLEHLKRTPNPIRLIATIVEIRRMLKEERPDILFLCSTTAGLLGSIAGFLSKNCVVLFRDREVSTHNLRIIYRIGGWAFRDPRPFWQNWLILLAEKLTAPLKDKIVVNSEIDRKLALKYKIAAPEKIVKIYNGLNPASLNFLSRQEARARLNRLRPDLKQSCLGSEFVVGCVANFYKTKGLEHLIASFRCLEPGSKQLVVIGEGRLRQGLETQIKKLGLEDRVMLMGRIPDAYKYLKAFDIFVLPSLKEGFPWIILEAIAAEVPIVATKVGAIPEILDEEFLVKPGDSQALAKKISWMLKHPAKAKLKPEFTSQIMLQKTEKLLQEAS